MTHWQILELTPAATAEQVKQAYRRLAHKHHPDKGGKAEDFKRIQEAYDYCRNNIGRDVVRPRQEQHRPSSPNDPFGGINPGNYSNMADFWKAVNKQKGKSDIGMDFGFGATYTDFNFDNDFVESVRKVQEQMEKERQKRQASMEEILRRAQEFRKRYKGYGKTDLF